MTAYKPSGFDLKPVIAALAILADRPEDWDSYGASPVAPEAIQRAIQIATKLAACAWDPPIVGATPDGAVHLLWRDGDRRLDLTITATAVIADAWSERRYVELGEVGAHYPWLVAAWQAAMSAPCTGEAL